MAKTKTELRAELAARGVSTTSRQTVAELTTLLRSQAGGDQAEMLHTRGAGRMLIRVTEGTTLVHGDPELGEERRAYSGGDEIDVPAPEAVQHVLSGAAIMLGAPDSDDNEGEQ